jgi:hypothetical protein
MAIHDAVCQTSLLKGLQHPEERDTVRLVRKRAFHITLRKRRFAAVQEIQHGDPRVGDPKVVCTQALATVHKGKDNLMQPCCNCRVMSHICNRVADMHRCNIHP